jgi:GDP/UDP-N,N'-diacetylbacillosamine 2-epimerase (hydrolysing)
MRENLGVQSYFSAMKHCKFLLGNTSSGIIEAASFKKFVINLGDRQKGRSCSKNVIHTNIIEKEIQSHINQLKSFPSFEKENIYFQVGSTAKIISILKQLR